MLDVAAFEAATRIPTKPVGEWAARLSPDRLRHGLAAAGVQLDDYSAMSVLVELRTVVAEHSYGAAVDGIATDNVAVAIPLGLRAERESGLVIDWELRALPLYDLAADVAKRDGRLVVRVADLDRLAGVCYWHVGLILLDRPLLLDRDELARVWAHELSHCLDPAAGNVSRLGSEKFADVLGSALLAEHPHSLAAASPAIERAERACGASRRRIPTRDDPAGLLDFALRSAVGADRGAAPEIVRARLAADTVTVDLPDLLAGSTPFVHPAKADRRAPHDLSPTGAL